MRTRVCVGVTQSKGPVRCRNRGRTRLDLHLELDGAGGRRAGSRTRCGRPIRAGACSRAQRLPSTRALAADLGVARGTVAEAYAQLVAEG